jgi:hypothetical protein
VVDLSAACDTVDHELMEHVVELLGIMQGYWTCFSPL